MEKTGWKILAIVFITLFVLETSVMIWAISYGWEEIENEQICMYDLCSDATSYQYADGICECYSYNTETGQTDSLRIEILD